MKVCVATDKGGLEDVVSDVFGRCATFTFVEDVLKSAEIKVVSRVKDLKDKDN